MMLKYALVLIY